MIQQSNSCITLGNPIFTEYDKATPPKPGIINGTHGLQVSHSGTGVVKGVNFSANGTVFIVPRSDGFTDHIDVLCNQLHRTCSYDYI